MTKFNALVSGNNMGTNEASALALGEAAHKVYLTLEDASEFRTEWCTGYVMGMFKVSEGTARAWGAMTRNERTAIVVKHAKGEGTAEKCWNAATAAFQYRVVKNSGRDVVANQTAEAPKLTRKLTRKQLAAIKACMELGVTMKLFGQGVAQLK